jgi:hypothetical protein
MTARRFIHLEKLEFTSRANLSAQTQSSIDPILKDLRSCSRKLQTTLSTHTDELRLLERLYYKGKNQHRSAIFWHRAVEMRRFGRRLAEMTLGEMTEALRCSFWGNALLEK